jgi:dephospho-CoA kinase
LVGGELLKVGLTGGIASGKSVVGEMFVALGAHLVQADRIAHQLMYPGEPVYNEVVRHFGRAILNPDCSVNRAKLAELAFGTKSSGAQAGPGGAQASSAGAPRIDELNRIVHPAVIRAQQQWMEEVGRGDPRAVAIVEAALLIEAGAATDFNHLIVVTASDEQRTARFAARQKIDLDAARKEVARRMAAQLAESDKVKMADFVIDNSGSLAYTREQVQNIWKKIQSEVELAKIPANVAATSTKTGPTTPNR